MLQALSSCSRVRSWLSDCVNSGRLNRTSLTRTLNDVVKGKSTAQRSTNQLIYRSHVMIWAYHNKRYCNIVMQLSFGLPVLNNETECFDDVYNPEDVFKTLDSIGWRIYPDQQVIVFTWSWTQKDIIYTYIRIIVCFIESI